MNKGKHILVVPLDWGLGHATRMMPVIDLLLSEGHEVSIGGNGRSGLLLKDSYPELSFYEFPSYNVKYPENDQFVLYTLSRLPFYLNAIYRENRFLNKLRKQFNIDIVISDNRYGLYHSKMKSIFVGHQLAIILPSRFSMLRKKLYQLHLTAISKFDQIWIPDFEGDHNLSGKLTHQYKLSRKAKFIGPISRFNGLKTSSKETSISILVILSGPEPQRTIFEKIVVNQAVRKGIALTIVQGKTEKRRDKTENQIRYISFADKNQLYDLIQASELVICRSGYSSIMDLSVLGKKAVFVPTPGQTEQKYLANRLKEQGVAYFEEQKEFRLDRAIEKAKTYSGFTENDYSNRQILHAIKAL